MPVNDNLVEQTSANYQQLIADNNSDGKIGDYCDIKSGYAFKSESWTNEGYKVIKIANIIDNTIDLDSCDCVSEANAQKSKQFFVKNGDILIAMTGATTGKIGIVPYCNEKITVNQRVGKFFLGDNPIDKLPFLVCTLLSKQVIMQLQPDGTAGSAQDNLSADDIKNIKISYPSMEEIDTFNNKNKIYFEFITKNNAEIRFLSKLKNTVLQTLSSH